MTDPIDPFRRIECVQGDITRETVDAIVNAANKSLRGGGGVDGAIQRAAGPGLLEECIRLYPEGCPTGDARITSGFLLPARFVIHAVGPVYQDGLHAEPALLASCQLRAIELAAANGVRTMAFPAISCGVYGYPWADAADVSLRAIAEGLSAHPTVERARVVLLGQDILAVFQAALAKLARP